MPNPDRQERFLVLFLTEKGCAEQRLERPPVDERRVETESWHLIDDRFGHRDVGNGPVLACGDLPNGPEGVAVVKADGLGATVEVGAGDRDYRLGAVCHGHRLGRGWQDVEFGGGGDDPLRFAVGGRGERREFQCAVVLVESGPQDRIAGVVEDHRTMKHHIVDAKVRAVDGVRDRYTHLDVGRPPRHDHTSLHPMVGDERLNTVLSSASQVGCSALIRCPRRGCTGL